MGQLNCSDTEVVQRPCYRVLQYYAFPQIGYPIYFIILYIANLPAAEDARLPSAGVVDSDGNVSPVVEMETVPLGQ